MMDPADNRPSTADHPQDPQRPRTPPPFAPVFTLVNNASTRTTHHPHVRYIFSDDDPDVLTQALAECEHADADEQGSGPTPANRAMLLDLSTDDDGHFSVSWASSLSPSWAVLNTQLSHISPPSSDAGHSGGSGDAGVDNSSRPDRLMLRIEGIEMSVPGSPSEMRISDETSHQRSGSASGSSSRHRERERSREADDYPSMLDEFDKRMATLRNVVNASEDRRKKITPRTAGEEDVVAQEPVAKDPSPSV
ncbi:hypothetical protein F5Y12DRAFT_606586 [Xylaria sp. FL1777]|nr:hypothetical protein F5Y12DRAFT_606586 [Xylaria sp. FL1777]